jgi:hypothetical protein
MAARKRGIGGRTNGATEIVGPPPERLAHGPVERSATTIADVDGAIGRPWRGLDTLARMERKGVIKPSMRQAGDRFHDEFRRAALDPLFAANPRRIPVQLNGSRLWLQEGSEYARQVVFAALTPWAASSSPAGHAPGMCSG